MGTVYLPTTMLMEELGRGRCVHVVGGCDLVDMVSVVDVVGVDVLPLSMLSVLSPLSMLSLLSILSTNLLID
jgi:hypothetical protein